MGKSNVFPLKSATAPADVNDLIKELHEFVVATAGQNFVIPDSECGKGKAKLLGGVLLSAFNGTTAVSTSLICNNTTQVNGSINVVTGATLSGTTLTTGSVQLTTGAAITRGAVELTAIPLPIDNS